MILGDYYFTSSILRLLCASVYKLWSYIVVYNYYFFNLMCCKLGYFSPAGTHLPCWVTGMGKICTRSRIWVWVISKIEGDSDGYGMTPPAPIPCGCHP